MNLTILLGDIVNEGELRYGQKRTTIYKNSLKVVDEYGKTLYISFVIFGKTAENANKSIKQNDKIIINGKLASSSYQDTKGNKKTIYTIEVNKFTKIN